MTKISVIIPTYNEQENIVEAIKSIDFADEIIIVDSFSKDNTVFLAKPLANKILQREYIHSASQKNWAIPQAKHEWVLILDADERVTSRLKNEILTTINSNKKCSAFWIKRQNYFMNKKINFSGWQKDKVIRLFKRDENKYEDKHVHAEIISKGKIGILKNKLIHNTFKSKKDYLRKIDFYAQLQAKDYDKTTKRITFFHTIAKPMFRFFKHYIINLGFLDGYIGFMISFYQLKAVKMRYEYLKEYRESKRN